MIDISRIKPITGKYCINVAVEIPKGSISKYEYDNTGKELRVVRFLHKKWRYPFNYGCIPGTLEDDGDMLDAIVLCDELLYPGTIIECVVYGAVETVDKGKVDNKIICIPKCMNVKKPSKKQLRKVMYYLKHYKYPEQDTTQIKGLVGYKVAMMFVQNAVANYNRTLPTPVKYVNKPIIQQNLESPQIISVFESSIKKRVRIG